MVKYADPPVHEEDDAKLSDVREKRAKNADKPTTASADKGQKDLPQILQQIDPEKKAQVLPQLYQQMQSMASIMMMGMGGGANGGGGNTNSPVNSIPSGIQNTIQDSFTGALAILVRKHGFERVIDIFTSVLDNQNINLLDPAYKLIVTNALSNLIKLALYFGPLNIPVSQYSNGVFGSTIPPSASIVKQPEIPDLWVKVYYDQNLDPYPGYQEWVSNENSNNKLWVKKPAVHYHFSSASQEVFYTSEKELADALNPYFEFKEPQPILTVRILNNLLITQTANIETNVMNNAVGNNTGNNQNSGGGNKGMGALQGMLGGQLQQLLQSMQSDMMPKTVLQGNVNQGIQEYTKHMGITNKLFELGSSALGGGMGGIGSLMNMGGISNILGGFGSNGGGISGVLGNVTGGAGLLGDFGGFGGGSNGGGGAAGSGFPTANFGEYNGGEVSDTGLQNVRNLLLLLGVEYE